MEGAPPVEIDPAVLAAEEPEALGGPGRRGPLRRCIVTGAVGPKDPMIRFVAGPDGMVVPDLEESLPGRGLWLTADPALVDKAVTKGAFSRAARRSVVTPPGLRDLLLQRLRRRCLDTIGLARRGGLAVAGFDKVAAALRAGRVGSGRGLGVWLEARDGAEDGRSKLAGLAKDVPLVDLFGRDELGGAFGRDDVVHAVVGAGPLALGLLRDVGRLARLLGGPAPGQPDGRADGG